MVKENKPQDLLPLKLAKPAQRALQNAGIKTLKQLSRFEEEEVSQLHGIGKNALLEIKKALADNGMKFIKKKK